MVKGEDMNLVDGCSKTICANCENEAIFYETPLRWTKICLNCGHFETKRNSFFLKLADVNKWRTAIGLRTISKLVKAVR
jgi:hypothetical protein